MLCLEQKYIIILYNDSLFRTVFFNLWVAPPQGDRGALLARLKKGNLNNLFFLLSITFKAVAVYYRMKDFNYEHRYHNRLRENHKRSPTFYLLILYLSMAQGGRKNFSTIKGPL